MANVQIDAGEAPGAYALAGLTLTFTTADPADNYETPMKGNEIVIVKRNANVDDTVITATPTQTKIGRTPASTGFTLDAADDFGLMGPFPREGWETNLGPGREKMLRFAAQDNDVDLAVFSIPGLYLEFESANQRARGSG